MKRIISVLLAVTVFASALTFSGCSKKSEVIFSLGEYTVTKSEYLYWMSYYKTSFLNVFIQAGYIDPDEYNEEFWKTSTTDGEMLMKMTTDSVDDSVKKLLVCMKLYDDYNLGASASNEETIKTAIEEAIAEDIENLGSRSELNKELSQYGLNIDGLKRVYEIEYKRQYVLEYLYGTNGTEQITELERKAYYEENYHRVKHVLIDLNEKYVLDDNGDRVMDTTTGYYKTEKLTDEEKTQRKELAQQVFEKAKNGEDFENLIKEYGEDEGMEYYTDGYYLKADDSFEENFLKAALEMQEGEVRLVESTYGLYIMKKYPLPDKGYADEINENFFSGLDDLVGEKKENEKLSEYFPQITESEEIRSQIDFSQVSLMSEELSGLSSED